LYKKTTVVANNYCGCPVYICKNHDLAMTGLGWCRPTTVKVDDCSKLCTVDLDHAAVSVLITHNLVLIVYARYVQLKK